EPATATVPAAAAAPSAAAAPAIATVAASAAAAGPGTAAASGTAAAPGTAAGPGVAEARGPYVHPVEIVLEGSYLDVLTYLQSLEALPWRFYWRVLDLQSGKYPLNRVRVELGTVSMTREWIGL